MQRLEGIFDISDLRTLLSIISSISSSLRLNSIFVSVRFYFCFGSILLFRCALLVDLGFAGDTHNSHGEWKSPGEVNPARGSQRHRLFEKVIRSCSLSRRSCGKRPRMLDDALNLKHSDCRRWRSQWRRGQCWRFGMPTTAEFATTHHKLRSLS
jgi:hypothetical protein